MDGVRVTGRVIVATVAIAILPACAEVLGFDEVEFGPTQPVVDGGGAGGGGGQDAMPDVSDDGAGGGGTGGSAGAGGTAGSGMTDGAAGDAGDGSPPFACEAAVTTSPVLKGVVGIDPAEPHPGDTVTVVVKSSEVDRQDAPPMELEDTSGGGIRVWGTRHMAGGKALYYYAITEVEEGDHCLLGRIGGQDEIAARFTVTPRPAGPPRCGGIYKVTANHQWTCDEQPDWGNEVLLRVLDADGAPVSGATLRLDWADTTVRPIYNDTDPPEPSQIPETVETDGSGVFHGYNTWPISEMGYMVFNVSVDGCASDIATELTTGWWETTNDGCKYCPMPLRNVWGHWSYTVEFRLDAGASEACVVPSDHAGQSACTAEHIHHDPDATACWVVQ